MLSQLLRSPDSPAATVSGANGAGLDPRAALANLLSQAEAATAPESNASAEAAAPDAAPDPTPEPTTEVDAGSNDFSSDETPQAVETGETPETPGPDEPPKTDPALSTDLNQKLAALSPAEQKAALDLVSTLQPGEIPRIAKLVAQRHQLEATVEELQAKLEAAETQAPVAAPAGAPALPEAVLKLKTLEQVAARQDTVTEWLDGIQDALDANPGPPETPVDLGDGKERTRQQLIDLRGQLRGEAKALSSRASQLRAHSQLKATQAQFTAQTRKDFPWLTDPQNPRTQAVQAALNGPFAVLRNTTNPEYWAAVIVEGQAALTTELQRRAKPAPATAPAGKVNAGKPHAANGAAAAPARPGLKTLLENHTKVGSRSSFAELIATGMGR